MPIQRREACSELDHSARIPTSALYPVIRYAQRAERTADDGVGDVSRALLCVATYTANSCAARCSICSLEYPQLLATKEMTSRDTVGLGEGIRTKKAHPGRCGAKCIEQGFVGGPQGSI